MKDKNLPHDPQGLSLVLGGPLYQLFIRTKLSGEGLSLLYRRVIVISLFCWLPILLLTAFEGRLVGESVAVPFLWDADFHIRFLVSMPLLIVAELVVNRRIPSMINQFLERRLIPDAAMEQFNTAIKAVLRLRNSVLAELIMIALVYIIGILFVWQEYIALEADTWYTPMTTEGSTFSMAGRWYVYVSLPIFQFLLLRWYYRIFIWARFLWHVSRIELNIVPTHPDGVGGLGFLAGQALAFFPLLLAHGSLLAALIANQIFYRGATLPEFFLQIAFLVIFLMCVVFGPLLVYTPQIEQARRKGVREYGALAARYTRDFDAKWLRGGAEANELLIGSPDIQSLADIANSFAVVRTMSIVIFTKTSIFELAVLTVLPIAPLLLTMMPVEEILKTLLGLLI